MKWFKGNYKKVLPYFLALIILVLPFGSFKVFAYSGGLLNGQTVYQIHHVNSGVTPTGGTAVTKVTDGNENTFINLAQNSINTSDLDELYYKFPQPVTLNGYQIKAAHGVAIQAFDTSGNRVLSIAQNNSVINGVKQTFNPVNNVSYILVIEGIGQTDQLYEMDFFGPDKVPPMNVTNLTASNITENSFNLSWTAPTDSDLKQYNIYLNGVLTTTIGKAANSYSFTNLSSNTSYSVKLTSVDTSDNESSGTTITVKTNIPVDFTAPANVTDLTGVPTDHSVNLNWTNPPDQDFSKVKVYENGVYKETVMNPSSSYLDDKLSPDTVYTYKVTSVDFSGNESSGSSISVRTLSLPEVKDVQNLKAATKYDRVKLTWDLPDSQYFHHAVIYRKQNQKQSLLQNIFSLGSTTAYAATTTDGYTPMFETNGTYWTDLTVTPDTNYEYKLTSVNTDGRESQGVVTDATTEPEPKPTIDGAAFSTDTAGNYVVSWKNPTTGTVRIIVGGEVLKEINAATKTYTIPKISMKYNLLGNPDVKLQPVGEYGTEGDSVVPQGTTIQTKIPFTVQDLIESGNGLLWLLAPFVLLSLSFLLVPKFRRLIFSAFGAKSKDPNIEKEVIRKSERNEKGKRGHREIEPQQRVESKEYTPKNTRETRTTKEPSIPRIRENRKQRETRLSIRKPRKPREPRKRRGINYEQ